MPKASPIITAFNAGELSPLLKGRVDLEKYYQGCEILENMTVYPHGGAVRRPGTYFCAEVKSSALPTRLIPFEFSTTQAYIIEVGHEYMRFYMNQGQITLSGTAYEISTPYQSGEIFQLKFVQSADTMYIVHPNHAPQKLTRTGHTAWSLTVVSFTANPFAAAGDYPAAVAFYEQRLSLAGTLNDPQKYWLSMSGDYEDMTAGAEDDDAIEYTIAADQVNAIKWMVPGRVLLTGTVGGEWRMWSGSASDPITPSNADAKRQTAHGSKDIQAMPMGNSVLFIQRAGRKIRELVYDYDVDGYVSADLSILAEHITAGGIETWAYQEEPIPMVVAKRADAKRHCFFPLHY
jgi:hypothetical protein